MTNKRGSLEEVCYQEHHQPKERRLVYGKKKAYLSKKSEYCLQKICRTDCADRSLQELSKEL